MAKKGKKSFAGSRVRSLSRVAGVDREVIGETTPADPGYDFDLVCGIPPEAVFLAAFQSARDSSKNNVGKDPLTDETKLSKVVWQGVVKGRWEELERVAWSELEKRASRQGFVDPIHMQAASNLVLCPKNRLFIDLTEGEVVQGRSEGGDGLASAAAKVAITSGSTVVVVRVQGRAAGDSDKRGNDHEVLAPIVSGEFSLAALLCGRGSRKWAYLVRGDAWECLTEEKVWPDATPTSPGATLYGIYVRTGARTKAKAQGEQKERQASKNHGAVLAQILGEQPGFGSDQSQSSSPFVKRRKCTDEGDDEGATRTRTAAQSSKDPNPNSKTSQKDGPKRGRSKTRN